MACRAAHSSSAATGKPPAEEAQGKTAAWMLSSAGRKELHHPEPKPNEGAPEGALFSHSFVGEPANFFDVSALDPDQPRRTVAARRVEVALVVEVGVARAQRVF